MNYRTAGTTLAVALLVGGVIAAESVKSGPQAGDRIPGAFHPLNVTGSAAGRKNCLVWSNGGNPVAVVFAREVSDNLTSLVKKIDAATASHSDCKMGSFVVFCNDKEGLDKELKDLADKEKLKKIVLSIDNPAGPKGYKIAKDADITVVLYVKHQVKANHAFKKGELKDADIDAIVKDVAKILPKE